MKKSFNNKEIYTSRLRLGQFRNEDIMPMQQLWLNQKSVTGFQRETVFRVKKRRNLLTAFRNIGLDMVLVYGVFFTREIIYSLVVVD